MRRWLFMLGGLIVWALHLFGAYTLASLADVVATADAPTWRALTAGFSALCFATALGLMAHALRSLRQAPDDSAVRFAPELAAGSAGLAAVGIAWQTLPVWIGH